MIHAAECLVVSPTLSWAQVHNVFGQPASGAARKPDGEARRPGGTAGAGTGMGVLVFVRGCGAPPFPARTVLNLCRAGPVLCCAVLSCVCRPELLCRLFTIADGALDRGPDVPGCPFAGSPVKWSIDFD